ncbi:MAG: diguanylate cyclase [Clostridiales bacterium]|nr:diguanylate cyclase [Clostridiales bacterium]
MEANDQLSHAVNIDTLQKLQDSFSRISGMWVLCTTPEGRPITTPGGSADAWKDELAIKALCKRCAAADQALHEAETGLTVIPVRLDTVTIANWVMQPPDGRQPAAATRAQFVAHLEALSEIIAQSVKRAQYIGRAARQEEPDAINTIENLKRELQTAKRLDRVLSVVMLRIDGLAYANSAYGYQFGDELRTSTAACIRANVRNDDKIDNLHGNIVVILPGCNRTLAEKRIRQSKESLGKRLESGNNEHFLFAYGIVENTEIPFEDSDAYIKNLFTIARRRMEENQRQTEMQYAGM